MACATSITPGVIYEGDPLGPVQVPYDAGASLEPMIIYEGDALSIPTAELGSAPGQVVLQIGGQSLNAKVLDWNTTDMTFQAPELQLASATQATLSIISSEGKPFEAIPVTLAPRRSATQNVTEAVVGSQLTLQGEQLGSNTGSVHLKAGNDVLPLKVIHWSPSSARIELPEMQLTDATDVQLAIYGGSGQLLDSSPIRLLPKR